jgi:16S rRNA (cytidine1402-2'-O)-methyltransferase
MLYVIATPLGNLEDISYRAVSQLSSTNLLIAENPSHSQKLLRHYGIAGKKIVQFAEHNEMKILGSLIKKLAEEDGCLISDAGTPAISDPGFRLVRACWENNIPVTAIPGANAAVALLSSGGLPTDRFLFVGFLPKTEPKLKQILEQAKLAGATLAAYESPQRIVKTATLLASLSPNANIVIGRELTKMHEELIRGTCIGVAEQLKSRASIKGEITLILSFK